MYSSAPGLSLLGVVQESSDSPSMTARSADSLLKLLSSVTSYTSNIPIAPR